MADDAGILSVDFLAGFAIFMIAFIWVATMVPGLFIGLRANSIDYDAVAYRTGVILAEDPGSPESYPGESGSTTWELLVPGNKADLKRFGLAVSKDTPGILDRNKVDRFFCSTTFQYPDDYRTFAIFGDYPYRFNITLRSAGNETDMVLGEPLPDGYGYIRRAVKIKSTSNASIDSRMIKEYGYNNTEDASFHEFVIRINDTALFSETIRDPRYQINPIKDRIIVNVTGLDRYPARSSDPLVIPAKANLTRIQFYKASGGSFGSLPVNDLPTPGYRYLYVDGAPVYTHPFPEPRPEVKENVSLVFSPGFFKNAGSSETIYVNLTFGLESPQQFLNSSLSGPFDYNYNPANVTQPVLRDAAMEVSVW